MTLAYAIEGKLEWPAGPTLRRNNGMGAWQASVRFGDTKELRLGRAIAFGGPPESSPAPD